MLKTLSLPCLKERREAVPVDAGEGNFLARELMT